MKTSKILVPMVIGIAVSTTLGFACTSFMNRSHADILTAAHQLLEAPQVAVVEFANVPSKKDLSTLRSRLPEATSLARFDSFDSDYFRRAFEITFTGDFAKLKSDIIAAGVAVNRVELVQTAALSSLVPSQVKGSGAKTDPLSNYQWALANNGQKILREIDDIHSETVVADPSGPKIDIGLTNVRARMSTEAKRDMIVAVVDSGLDTAHEDIVNNIAMNKAECDGGKIPFRPKEDKDGNGYKGDCMGWNFMGEGDGDNQVDDDLGHGTHVAGIIAAEIGNGIGVAGVAPRLKILPIKVTGAKDNLRSMTNRVAKAILYATKMKADVINFSLGWPTSSDSEYLRQAFSEALKAGITIVAAAGNNTSAVPVFPCSYEGVICVGAVTISGEVANFSNYGGQVDVMAPGEEILSLFPKALEPKIFSVKGYEIKNGTSQAAPFVSAQIAILKALIPGISADEIQARLAASAKSVKWGEKFAMNGMTDITRALAVKAQPVVRPDFKKVYEVLFNQQDRQFKFSLPVKNFWVNTSSVKVDVSISSTNVSIDQSSANLGTLAGGETKSFDISGHIQDTGDAREARLTVKISTAANDGMIRTETFTQEIAFTRLIDNDPNVQSFPLALTSANKALRILSVNSLRNNEPYPDFYYSENADGKNLVIKLIRWKNGAFVEERPIDLGAAQAPLYVWRVDVNYDGVSDYVIASVGHTGSDQWIQLSYLDDNLAPIFGKQQNLRVKTEGATIDTEGLASLRWMPAQTPYGSIAMPLFRTSGGLPKADQNPDPFAFKKVYMQERVYYFEPMQVGADWVLATRAFDNTKWMSKIRAELGLRFRDALGISTLLTQSAADFAAGRVRALVQIGSSTLKKYRMITMEGISDLDNKAYRVEATDFSGQTFEGASTLPAIDLNQVVPVLSSQSSLASFYSPVLGRVTLLNAVDPSRIQTTQTASPPRAQDNFLGFVQSYVQGSKLMAFYQTKSHLVLKVTGAGNPVQLAQPIDRSSFIDSDLTSALFYPITMGESSQLKRPAIYLDASLLSANRVYLWTLDKGKFFAPMNLNVEIPKGCRALAPHRMGTSGQMAYVFLCTDGNSKYVLKTLNVE